MLTPLVVAGPVVNPTNPEYRITSSYGLLTSCTRIQYIYILNQKLTQNSVSVPQVITSTGASVSTPTESSASPSGSAFSRTSASSTASTSTEFESSVASTSVARRFNTTSSSVAEASFTVTGTSAQGTPSGPVSLYSSVTVRDSISSNVTRSTTALVSVSTLRSGSSGRVLSMGLPALVPRRSTKSSASDVRPTGVTSTGASYTVIPPAPIRSSKKPFSNPSFSSQTQGIMSSSAPLITKSLGTATNGLQSPPGTTTYLITDQSISGTVPKPKGTGSGTPLAVGSWPASTGLSGSNSSISPSAMSPSGTGPSSGLARLSPASMTDSAYSAGPTGSSVTGAKLPVPGGSASATSMRGQSTVPGQSLSRGTQPGTGHPATYISTTAGSATSLAPFPWLNSSGVTGPAGSVPTRGTISNLPTSQIIPAGTPGAASVTSAEGTTRAPTFPLSKSSFSVGPTGGSDSEVPPDLRSGVSGYHRCQLVSLEQSQHRRS